ncbi:MAG: hypothetical protein R3C52_04790 [Hyphomonadaceae bacterium]
MLHETTQKLVVTLWEMSERNDVPWRATSENTWAFDTEGYVVEVCGAPPQIRILRRDGREIERASTVDLEATRWPMGGGDFARRVQELASAARRGLEDANTPNPAPSGGSAWSEVRSLPRHPVEVAAQPTARFGQIRSFDVNRRD